jgi:polysaccharide chain length determinant protein (PEP-CTERM system associated)
MEDVRKLFFFYMDQLWRRRWLALAFAWAVCVIGWTFVAFLPDRYTSEARIYVDTSSLLNPLLRGLSVGADEQRRDQEVALMQRTLTSRPNLAKVAQMTDMDKGVSTPAEQQELLGTLEQHVAVRSQGPNLFAVSYTDNSPVLAKNVVQSLLTIFVENSTGNNREDIQNARSFVEAQISDYEKQLRAAEQRLADFKVKNVAFFAGSTQGFAARLEGARDNRSATERELNDLIAQRNQLKQQLDHTSQYMSVDAQVLVEGGSPLTQRIKFLQQKLDELRLQYTEKHPEVIATKRALAEVYAQADKLAKNPEAAAAAERGPRSQVPNEVYTQLSLKLADADAKVISAQRRLADADATVKEMEKRADDAPRVEAEYTSLNRDYEVLKGNYESLLQRRESARIAQAADTSTEPVQFRIIAAPEVPAEPAGPARRLFNLLVLLVGIGAGCGFVVLLTKIDDRVAVPEDLHEFGGFKVLGCVSPVLSMVVPLTFKERHGRFMTAAGALAGMFILFLLVAPNLSALPGKIAMRLG